MAAGVSIVMIVIVFAASLIKSVASSKKGHEVNPKIYKSIRSIYKYTRCRFSIDSTCSLLAPGIVVTDQFYVFIITTLFALQSQFEQCIFKVSDNKLKISSFEYMD